MPGRSNLATAEPPRRQLPRNASCPLVGALGGALTGLMTGDPLGACIGRGGLMGRPTTDDATKGDEP
ncbi:hypothetical protein MKK75_17575 [Methylobacterium sp. J-030]|uniref:hypothetical protein n=1 Tax=Methylobacterium sp. J-030 TaxID=2836627 RepID=UPI001FBB696C|nr:hypothetical protein [Methylobacterium sp. J-030]MCJ2070582.1 hypothetical protein [Methylobacterium sp. J-030]